MHSHCAFLLAFPYVPSLIEVNANQYPSEDFVRLCYTAQYELLKGINLIPMPRYLLEMANHLKFINRRPNMNKDQVKGTAKDIAGKIQEEAGRAVGSKEQEAKGLGKQVSGKVQKKYGDAKEAVKDAADDL